MKARKLIEGARDLIRDKSRWTVGTYARNAQGMDAEILGNAAVTFCALGALHKTAEVDNGIDLRRRADPIWSARSRLQALARDMGFKGVGSLNDHGGHVKVMELFDRALTELKNADTENA